MTSPLPWQRVPMPNNSFCWEFFPHLQSKPPLCHLGFVPWEQSPIPSCQGVMESEKVPPELPLLQAEAPSACTTCPGLKHKEEDPTWAHYDCTAPKLCAPKGSPPAMSIWCVVNTCTHWKCRNAAMNPGLQSLLVSKKVSPQLILNQICFNCCKLLAGDFIYHRCPFRSF